MPSRRCSRIRGSQGFTIAEVTVVLGIVGILAVGAMPSFLTYYQGSRLRVAAEQVEAFLNRGRQLGIRENVGVCVHTTTTAMHYHVGTCAAAAWVGPGTDAAGNVALPAGFSLTATGDTVFSYLGAANPGATYTVQNTQTGQTLRVFVAASGRITIGP